MSIVLAFLSGFFAAGAFLARDRNAMLFLCCVCIVGAIVTS